MCPKKKRQLVRPTLPKRQGSDQGTHSGIGLVRFQSGNKPIDWNREVGAPIAAQTIGENRNQLALSVELLDIYAYPTVRGLADRLDRPSS